MKSYHELFSPQITNTHWEIHTEVTMKNTYKAMKSRPMGLDIFHLKPAMEAMTMKSTSRIVTQSQAIPLEYMLTLGGEISSDLYGLSGCDILNLTFCRLDFHQLLIKIS